MENIWRAYVEKKPGEDGEARALLADLRENLGLSLLTGLRIAYRYDVEGLTGEEWENACRQVLCDEQVETLYMEDLPLVEGERALAVEYLPGQYDQKADSAAQCFQLITLKEQPAVQTAVVYILKGALSPADIDAFYGYCSNPVDSRLASTGKPSAISREIAPAPDVPVLDGFRLLEEKGLCDFRQSYGLSMSEADLAFCQAYFRKEDRDPSVTELRVIDTYWSDHCRHTTFNTVIEEYTLEDGPYKQVLEEAIAGYFRLRKEAGGEDRPLSLMDMATVNARAMRKAGQLEDLELSEEVNASSIRVTADTGRGKEPWLVMFKNETHNHPTEIEPFGGAATCVGGAIRDPMSGRSYVYQAMRITGSADPLEPVGDTLPGKLPQRVITRQAAAGFSQYSNQIGLAASLADELYHPGYKAKRMELGALVGAAPEADVRRETPEEGDLVLLLGGPTGRDGLGGATGSSKAQDEQSIETAGAEVQKGNAPMERKLVRLFRNPAFARLVKRCNDFGAGGVSVAIGELAPGLDIDLDQVPVKYEGLDGTELAISESQERMAVVIPASSLDTVLAMAAAENVEAAVVARIAGHNRMKMTWRSKEIVNLSRTFLDAAGVGRKTKAVLLQPKDNAKDHSKGHSYFVEEGLRIRQAAPTLAEAWLKCMAELNQCSKKGLIQRFDSSAGAVSLLSPLGGKNQETPAQAMAARLPVLSGETTTCSWMSYGFDPALSQWSPFHGALYAVTDALTKLACAGGDPFRARLSFQEFFPSLGEDPAKWGLPMAALLGAQTALSAFGVPAVGGKDSMSGSFLDLEVPPTLCAFALVVGSENDVLSPEWKKPGSLLAYFPVEAGAGLCPDMEQIKKNFRFIANNRKHIHSAYALGNGGLAAAIAKAAFGNGLGAEIVVPFSEEQLFTPAYGSILLELDADFPRKGIQEQGGVFFGQILGQPEIRLRFSGANADGTGDANADAGANTGAGANADAGTGADTGAGSIVTLEIERLRQRWSETLEPVFPAFPPGSGEAHSGAHGGASGASNINASGEAQADAIPPGALPLYFERNTARPAVKQAKVRVLLPVFPGTHGEYESARVFEEAGAETELLVLRNLRPEDVKESLDALAAAIARSHILMLPGGFSAGGEPGGGGKMIAAAFRYPRVTEQTDRLLREREGLILGIGDGFQALLRLGLAPYGAICQPAAGSPTLTVNRIGRHQSTMVKTKIISCKSPWYAGVEPGSIQDMPFSHGEGRIQAESAELIRLFHNGQIAAQYVDEDGVPSMDIRYNPGGSAFAIESLTSPDGRVLGKMGHNERARAGLYRNVPGQYDQRLFANGVNYFR